MATATTTSPLGPSAPINYGIPDTSQGATFELEEQAAAAARGQTFASLWQGFQLPPAMAGDFWQVYAMAEQFAANTGWKYLPTPQMLVSLVRGGNFDPHAVYQWMAVMMKVDPKKMPWASLGLNSDQYNQRKASMGDSLYGITGHTDFASAGLAGLEATAMYQQWSPQQLTDYILQHPTLSKQYGYLAVGYDYNRYSQYKLTNATALKQRYGTQYTDAQAIQSLTDPQTAFHAQGGAFGQYQPFVQSQTTIPTGRQSSVR